MSRYIHIKNAVKSYGDNMVLNNLSLDIKAGEITTVVAPNGIGKTTLLSMISGLLIPERGTVEYEGLKRSDISIVFSGEKNLYMKNTVKENLIYFGVIQGLSKREVLSEIDTYSRKFKFYNDIQDKLVEVLSYGQKRLVSIFSALVVGAKCIIVDEASEGLDMSFVALLVEMLRSISEDKIILLVSHDYDFVANVSDRILFLKDGVISREFDKLSLEQVKKEYVMTFMNEV